jgi:hypothetical protein
LALIVGVNLVSSYYGGRALPGEPFVFGKDRVAKDHSALIEWLQSNNIDLIATNYWIGYRLAFETKEEVRTALFQEPAHVRLQQYEREASTRDSNSIPMVLSPAQAKLVERGLRATCVQYKREERSGYVVLYDRVSPQFEVADTALRVSASVKPEAAPNAVDRNASTRWGSGMPQRPGMEFLIELEAPLLLRAVAVELGAFVHDFPRALEIEVLRSDGQTEKVLSTDDTRAVRYLQQESSRLFACVPQREVRAVRLRQQGSDSFFDWSIAELALYR